MHPVAAEGGRDNLPDEDEVAPKKSVKRPRACLGSVHPIAHGKVKRSRLGSVPADARGKLGCGKCVQSANGCTVCRKRLGLKIQVDGSWSW